MTQAFIRNCFVYVIDLLTKFTARTTVLHVLPILFGRHRVEQLSFKNADFVRLKAKALRAVAIFTRRTKIAAIAFLPSIREC